jgi:hypothetical protein
MWRRRAAFASRELLVVVDVVSIVLVIVVIEVIELVALLFAVAVIVLLVVFELVVVRRLELDRRIARHAEQGTTFRAGQLVADVDVELIDVNR